MTTALAVLACGGGLNASAAAQSVYSSPSGNGTACSQTAPCSITQAQSNARSLASAGTSNVNVILGSGTYSLSSPLVFSALDSGQNGYKVSWQAAPGTQPLISGGTSIAGWAVDTAYPNLWSATVPSALNTRQLYANGVRLPRASGTLGAGPLGTVSLTWTSTGYTSSDATMSSWKNPSNIEFVYAAGHGAWTEPRCDVASISSTTITMRQPCWNNQQLLSTPTAPDGTNPSGGFYPLGPAKPTRVENAFELLTPGHWYLDQSAGKMYYYPQAGDAIASLSFVAPVLEQLVVSTGSSRSPVHDITFQGLEFSYTTWFQPSGNDGFSEMQANMSVTGPGGASTQGLCGYVALSGTCPFGAWTRPPAAVDMTGTQNIAFLGNKFDHLGGAGLGLLHGANTDLIQGNEITDVSSNGIELGGVDDPQPAAFATTDIAIGKTATQSSTGYGGVPSGAVDGNTDGSFYDNSVSHTNYDTNAWWQVDLGSVMPLTSISIYNRTDCCADRLTDYWVFVSATPFNTTLTPTSQASQPGVWSSHQPAQAGAPTSITGTPSGRYVMVQLSGTNYLSLAEVQVFASTAGFTQNTLSDNWIHGTGAEFPGAVGLFAGYSSNTTIKHNQINDLPYSGISFGWGGWHTNASTPNANPNINANNAISNNLIYNTMRVRGDGGAIYINGSQGTSMAQGLTISGNVAFANPLTNIAYYTDAGSSNVTINGNVQYGDNGYFNGGCSTPGPVEVENNYYEGMLNVFACANTGSSSQFTGSGNVAVPSSPTPNTIPSSLLSAAGLEAAYTGLTTSHAPVVVLSSQISGGQILISGSGFTAASQVTVGGVACPVTYLSSNYLLATPAGTSAGQVAVTTTATAGSPGTGQAAPAGYDVILLAGQSNMVGYGQGPDNATDAAVSPRVFMWNANTSAIVPAVDPLVQNDNPEFVGMGLTFAKAYAASIASNRNVLLVGSAQGGTSFASGRWQAPSGDLAATAVARANAAMVAAGAGAKFVGILWHQGESDLSAPTPPPTYQADLLNLISYFRTSITGASNKTPVVVGEFTYPWMIDTINSGVNVAVQQGIIAVFHNLPDTLNNTAWVSTAGLAGDVYAGDVHFSALAQRQLGRRYADRFFEALQGIPQAETSQESYGGTFWDDGRSYNNNTFPVNFPGVVTGTVNIVADPVRGNVAQVSGGKGYITYSVPATTFNGDYTKLVWFKPGAANTINNLISGINPGQSHFLAAVTGNGIVTVAAGHQASSASTLYINTTVAAPAGTWMQIGLVYTAAAKTMTAYVNGVAVQTVTNVPVAPSLSGQAVPLTMGSYGTTAGTGVDGSMASNSVWTSALTAAQIAALYQYELSYRAGW